MNYTKLSVFTLLLIKSGFALQYDAHAGEIPDTALLTVVGKEIVLDTNINTRQVFSRLQDPITRGDTVRLRYKVQRPHDFWTPLLPALFRDTCYGGINSLTTTYHRLTNPCYPLKGVSSKSMAVDSSVQIDWVVPDSNTLPTGVLQYSGLCTLEVYYSYLVPGQVFDWNQDQCRCYCYTDTIITGRANLICCVNCQNAVLPIVVHKQVPQRIVDKGIYDLKGRLVKGACMRQGLYISGRRLFLVK